MRLSTEQAATIRAALELYRQKGGFHRVPRDIQNVATMGGQIEPLNAAEIDHLIARAAVGL